LHYAIGFADITLFHAPLRLRQIYISRYCRHRIRHYLITPLLDATLRLPLPPPLYAAITTLPPVSLPCQPMISAYADDCRR